MKCSSPVDLDHGQVSCGQCQVCRITRMRVWQGKIILECQSRPWNWFTTLTYAPEHLPEGGTLSKEDGYLFRKRLYKALGQKLRFLFVGEYGEKTFRPHYHMIAFGVDHPHFNEILLNAWGKGHVQSPAPVTVARAAYIGGYCLKKWTRRTEYTTADTRLGSRHPEFAQMSRRPALGDDYVTRVLAPWYSTREGAASLAAYGDVAGTFAFEGKLFPIGNRHRRMMRRIVGIPEKRTDLMLANPSASWYIPERADAEEKERRRIHAENQRYRAEIFRSRTQRV